MHNTNRHLLALETNRSTSIHDDKRREFAEEAFEHDLASVIDRCADILGHDRQADKDAFIAAGLAIPVDGYVSAAIYDINLSEEVAA